MYFSSIRDDEKEPRGGSVYHEGRAPSWSSARSHGRSLCEKHVMKASAQGERGRGGLFWEKNVLSMVFLRAYGHIVPPPDMKYRN